MGLDVTAYERATPYAGETPSRDAAGHYSDDWWNTADELGLIEAFVYEGFERSLRGLQSGSWYTTSGKTFNFRAGSYSGYNRFRAELALAALGVTPGQVWDHPDGYAESPFFELIHFADNEGTIGPDACADLARDFAEQREAVLPKWDPADPTQAWFRNRYDTWQQAFELAAVTGLVRFC